MAYAILSESLTRRFGSTVVVKGLDLAIPTGAITAFLGPNGAGKTTTIRMLLGLLKPHSGSCQILGLPPGHPEGLAQIGALVEYPSLYDHLTGLENVEITRLMKGAVRSETPRVLEQVGLAKDAKRVVGTYSLGMRQRLGVALALLGHPRLLILDEPSNGLDPSGILEMRALIRSLSGQGGITIFLSSHLLAEVEQVASHVVVIDRGRLKYQGALQEMGDPGTAELLVRLDSPGEAAALLGAQGIQSRLQDDGGLLVQGERENAPRVAQILVHGGFAIYEMRPCQRNLEARFLGLLEAP